MSRILSDPYLLAVKQTGIKSKVARRLETSYLAGGNVQAAAEAVQLLPDLRHPHKTVVAPVQNLPKCDWKLNFAIRAWKAL